MAAVCLFLLMGLTGIPVFAAFKGGPQVLLGPSGGFLMGYLFAAGTVSALQGWAHCYSRRFFICILAVLACYVPGALWLIFLMGKPIPEILSVAVLPFLPGDLLKSLAAPALVQRLEKALVIRSFNVKTSASSAIPPRP